LSILIFCAAVEVLGQFESACGGLEDLFNYFRIVYKARINAIEPKDGNFEILTMNTKKYENIVNIKAAIPGVGRETGNTKPTHGTLGIYGLQDAK
jgi:hypothetical protein